MTRPKRPKRYSIAYLAGADYTSTLTPLRRGASLHRPLRDKHWETMFWRIATASVLAIARFLLGLRYRAAKQFVGPLLYRWLSFLSAFGQDDSRAKLAMELGSILIDLSDYNGALAALQDALRFFHEHNVPLISASILGRIGNCHSYLGGNESALACFQEALTIQRRFQDRNGEAISLTDIARVEALLGRKHIAMAHYEHALALSQTVGNVRNEATVLSSLGLLFIDLGDNDKAQLLLRDALVLRKRGRDSRGEAYTLNTIGYLNWRSGHYESALGRYKAASSLAHSLGEKRLECGVHNNVGRLFSSQRRFLEAIAEYEATIELAREIGERRVEAVSLLNLGRAYVDSGQLEPAIQSFSEGLALVTEVGDKAMEVVGLHGLAECAYAQGQSFAAREKIELALEIIESERSHISSHELRTAYSASAYQFYSLYVDILMTLDKGQPNHGFAELALKTNERLKARSLFEMLAEARNDVEGSETRLVSLVNSIRAKLEQLSEERVRAELLNSNQEQKVVEELVAAETEYDRAVQRLGNSRRSFENAYPPPLSIEDIRRQVLDDESILLSFMFNERKGHLWIVSRDAFYSLPLPNRSEIDNSVSIVYRSLIARTLFIPGETQNARAARIAAADLDFLPAAKELSASILGPARKYLNRRRLLVVADGPLLHLPMAVLPLSTSNSDYVPIVYDHEVIALPSASLVGQLRTQFEHESSHPKQISIFADPVFSAEDTRLHLAKTLRGPNRVQPYLDNGDVHEAIRNAAEWRGGAKSASLLPRLPGTRTEAMAISALVSENNRLLALDFDASLNRLLETDVANSQILHFATHGILDPEHANLSGIMLSLFQKDGSRQAGFLSARHVLSKRFNSSLAVLSACRTGIGREIVGDGLVGLPRAFMFSGVRRLLVTMWAVDDAATSDFMAAFYRELLGSANADPSSVLRTTQLQTMKHSERSFPYFWGAFSLYGDWKPFRLALHSHPTK
jgi:CHAT domain-containing protein/Tfp pilus assembly protein PilF